MIAAVAAAQLRVKSRKTIGNGQYLVTPGYSNVSRKTWTRYAMAGAETLLPVRRKNLPSLAGSLHFIRMGAVGTCISRHQGGNATSREGQTDGLHWQSCTCAGIKSRRMMSTASITEHNTTSNLIVFRGRRPTIFTGACSD